MEFVLTLIAMATVAVSTWQTLPPNVIENVQTGWVYPGAKASGNNIYQSLDDPTKITNWYQDKINASGMNAVSAVYTNTNNNVLNKLSGSNGSEKVSVEVSKKSSDDYTLIFYSR